MSSLVNKFAVDLVCVLSCFRATWRSILFLTVGFMGLQCFPIFSPGEDRSVRSVGRDHLIFLLCLPSSAHLFASSFMGSPRWAFILMKTVSSPCSILSRRNCTMSLMMSASGLSHMEGGFPSAIHFWDVDRKHAAESDWRIIGFLSSFPLALPIPRTLPLVPLCWRSCLPLLFPAGSILLCSHLIYRSPPP